MAKRRRNSLSFGWILVLVIIAFGAAASVTYLVSSNIKQGIREPIRKPVVVKPPKITEVIERNVVIYMPENSSTGSYLVPVTKTTDMEGDILDVSMKVLLETSEEDGPSDGFIPKGTDLISKIEVKDGVADVDFSKELQNFSGGSTEEALVLNSIAHTLVDNSDGKVKKVRILVEGNAISDLGGHFDLTEPIEADSTLLKSGK